MALRYRTEPARETPAQLTATLVLTCLVVATMTSLGTPLLPSIAAATHVSLGTGQWILTAALLSGGLATPIMGHLADGPQQRQVVLTTLTIVLAGSVLAVTAPTFGLLVVARAMQGCGFGVVPVTMAIARRHQESRQAARTVATLSVTTAVGVGLGYPMSGLLDTVYGYRAAFWLGVVVAAAALVCAWLWIPASDGDRPPARLDAWSTGLMCISLTGALLTWSEGQQWGWTSPAVLIAGPSSLVLAAIWVRRELRLANPLVDFRIAANPIVLTADICTLLVSITMYLYMPTVVDIVQARPDDGIGLGQSVLVSGLVLVPMSACTLAASLSTARVPPRIARTVLLPGGCLVFAVAMVFFAFAHSQLWEAFVSMSLLGVGVGLTFSVMPRMIVATVDPSVTGHALGLYQVLRGIGMAIGSALCGVLIAAYTPAGATLPAAAGYKAALLVGGGLCVATAVLAAVLPVALGARAAEPERQVPPGAVPPGSMEATM